VPRITDNIAINATGGATVDVTCSMHCRKMIIEEDPNNGAAQGIVYSLPDDNFVSQKKLGSGEQLILGNTVAHQNNAGPIVGNPQYNSGGNTVPATVVAKLVSQALATSYRKTEVE
jgi:hypothetical protein